MKIDSWEFKDDAVLSVGQVFTMLSLVKASERHTGQFEEKYGFGPDKFREIIESQMAFLNENRKSGPAFDGSTDFNKLQEVYAELQDRFLERMGT
jgi:hypothetical protein